MASFKVPQAYRPDPGQLVMVPDQSTVAETRTGARMVWVGIIIGGAFIAAAVLWTVNGMLEFSVGKMKEGNERLNDNVRQAELRIEAHQARLAFFREQSPRIRARNEQLQDIIDSRPPVPPPPTPPSPRLSRPPGP